MIWKALMRTDRVAGLLGKDLCQFDHICIIVKLFREIDHRISRVLLITSTGGSKKGRRRGHGNWVTLLATTCGVLKCHGQRTILNARQVNEGRTQAFSHGVTASIVVCAMRFECWTGMAVTTVTRKKSLEKKTAMAAGWSGQRRMRVLNDWRLGQ
jgi:hypothetical protein